MSKQPGTAKTDESGRVQYSFYLPHELYDRAASMAIRRRTTMAQIIRDALTEYLANYE